MSVTQAPIGSGFGAATTAAEALAGIDLSGKLALVTGGYSGLGLETTRALAKAGAHIVVPARSIDKAQSALAGMGNVEIAALDLADPGSIEAFSADFLGRHAKLDILINNAAIMACPLTRDARGFEMQFATNHLGHFHLTARLWQALQRAASASPEGARIVALSSVGHRRAAVNMADPNFEHRAYDKWDAYGQAKSANALFALGAHMRGQASGIRAFSVHPGGILTDLQRFLPREEQIAMGWMDEQGNINALFKSPAQGASTSVWCATAAALADRGGAYCEDCDIAQAVPADSPGWTGVRPWAMDASLADQLWRLSETMVGVTYPV